jgi:hypothetical protein
MKHLSKREYIWKVLSKWLIPTQPQNKVDLINLQNLNLISNYMYDIDFIPFIKAFSDRLNSINYYFSNSEKVSGAFCFYGSLFTSLLNFGHVESIDDLFTFALGYMLIDHFLDNKDICLKEKEEKIREIGDYLLNGIVYENNELIQVIQERYNDLILRKPYCKKYFLHLFRAEWEGHKLEKNNNLTQNQDQTRFHYLDICEKKGGYTALCIASIMDLLSNEEDGKSKNAYNLGDCIQRVDDMLDIDDNKELGIYTLIRYDIENKNVDQYIYETCVLIENLSSNYNFFKPILLTGIILSIHDHPHIVSEDLFLLIKSYDHFSNISKAKLVDFFHEKLFSYIQLH